MKLLITSQASLTGEKLRVELISGHLLYKRWKYTYVEAETAIVTPSDEDWKKFWESVERCGVWNWKPAANTVVLDGTDWEIDLSDGTHNLGLRNFRGLLEPYADEQGYSQPFKLFLKTLQKLLGGREVGLL